MFNKPEQHSISKRMYLASIVIYGSHSFKVVTVLVYFTSNDRFLLV